MLVADVDLVDQSPTALQLPDDLAFDEWAELGRRLLDAYIHLRWWVGDWLHHGERLYGAQYLDIPARLDLEESTVSDYQWVASSVPPERRRSALSWTHHRIVAALPDDAQVELLDAAEGNGWRVRQLQDEVRRRRPQCSSPGATNKQAEAVTRTLAVTVPTSEAEHLSGVLTAMADQLRVEIPAATVDVR